MRTIKFRGKNEKWGWAYGSFVYDYDENPMICIAGYSHTGCAFSGCTYVIPETVGQFTGLLDKNGKEIYEGDLLQSPDILTIRLEVYYNEALGSFCLAEHTNTDGVTKGTESLGKMLHYYPNMEIIGNIHDTP